MKETDERTKLQIDCQQLLAFTQCAYAATHTGRSSYSSRYFRKVSFTKNVHSAIIHTLIIFFSSFFSEISNAPLNTLKAFQFPVVAFIISVFQLSQTRKQCVSIVVALKP